MPCNARTGERGAKYWIVRRRGGGVRKTYVKPKPKAPEPEPKK